MSSFSSQQLSSGWEFKNSEDASWMPVAKVPSVVHLDLMDNNVIPDTSQDLNELDSQWVGEKSWIYRCTFSSPEATDGDRIALAFEGLDTFSKVQLNDTDILQTDNMFVSHHVEVTSLVHSTSPNVLEIVFDSAEIRSRQIRKEHPEHNFIGHLGEVERLGIRKAPSHWGWDWGPKFMTAGPWRPVRLERYSSRVEDVWIEYSLDDNLESCEGVIAARIDGHADEEIRLALRDPKGELVFETRCAVGSDDVVRTSVSLKNLALWNPHGYGERNRYFLDAELFRGDHAVHLKTHRVGFRRAELIQELDVYGKSFYFRVNAVDIFAGGSNWIPADSFTPRISSETYKKWLESMVEGNQVMTRVWGGGIYEEDVFYDTCDELGILVWQDFIFACGSYPAFPAYVQSVEDEARCNVRRLRNHPSVIIYAGGNENYYIQETYNLKYDYDGDKDPQSWLKSTFPSRYIFEHLLPKVMSEESPSTIYRPDSPWGDGKRILDPSVGDIHQWEVWHGIMRPYQTYDKIGGRFNSEFGMEAFPHMSTIDKFVTDPSEKYSQSLTMDFHNKARGYERRLAGYVLENFRASTLDLKYWAYLTQIVQSEAMNYSYRCWRRHWGSPSSRRCGGALVWQLNDCWPTISWAIMDYYLVKKPAFYAIKRSMAPVSVTVLRAYDDWTAGHAHPPTASKYDVWVASSKTSVIKDAVLELRFTSIRTGAEHFPQQRRNIKIQPNCTTLVCENIAIEHPRSRDAFVISAKLVINDEAVSTYIDWPQPYKYLAFDDRGLQVKLAESRNLITISATKPVKGLVFDERPGLWFSDNGLDLIPGEIYTVDVKGLEENESLGWTFLGIS